jgi:hypothetical protein
VERINKDSTERVEAENAKITQKKVELENLTTVTELLKSAKETELKELEAAKQRLAELESKIRKT